MQVRNWEDYFGDEVAADISFASLGTIDATATPTPGTLSPGENGDMIAVTLNAGQTYSFDMRGTADGLHDPYLFLLSTNGSTVIAQDDDGGAGTSSMITYTPTVAGTYYLYATSYTVASGGNNTSDVGAYTINTWSPEADVPGSNTVSTSLPTAVALGTGTYYGNMEAAGDNDYFAVNVTAGMVYSFAYSGGVSGAADRNGEAGENLARLTLYNSSGTQLSTNFNYESGTSYFAATSGTVYLRAQSLEGAGGYSLDVSEIDPSTRDPLQAFNWDSADNIDTVEVDGVDVAYVYFAPAGENFGERADNGVSPMITYGWTPAQQAAVMHALTQYTPITGIEYRVTTDVNQAEFRMLTTTSTVYGARFYPQDPSYGTQQGIGTFNLNSGGFGADPNSLLPGGFAYGVILHEFGHAHGVAHPHDTGGGSEVMLGVTASQNSFGVYDLNQGVYTVMSYNDGWNTHPDGDRNYSAANRASGWSETLGAFDIAVLQARYGQHAANTGDNVYTIADTQAESSYMTIWDTSGVDTIAYGGARDAQIDLLAATLDYTPTGGGAISYVRNVWGGYTIANGVTVENATGGSGNDVLLGNAAANVLTGNAGNDTLVGREGVDTANYATAGAGVTVDLAAGTASGGAGNDTLATIENVVGSAFNDSLTGNGGANRIDGGTGNDRIISGGGMDVVLGGNGLDVITLGGEDDVFVAEIGSSKVTLKTGTMSLDIITDFDTNGNDLIDLSGLGSFTFHGTDANKNAGDVTYKTYTSINGAENALGFDIDGQPGAGGVPGPVTVVYGNTDGGRAEFAIVLLNTSSVDANDFNFGATTLTSSAYADHYFL